MTPIGRDTETRSLDDDGADSALSRYVGFANELYRE